MRASPALAVVATLCLAGVAGRALASRSVVAPISLAPAGTTYPDLTGEVRGRFVAVSGCGVWVAALPGYLTAVPPGDVDWGKGPADVAYAFAGRAVPASLARTVSLAARAGELAAAGLGLGWPFGGLWKAMAPPGCPGAAARALRAG